MATSVGQFRVRGRSQGAQLLLGLFRSAQRHGVAKNDCTRGGYGLALLRGRQSSSTARSTDTGDVRGMHCYCNAPEMGNAVVGTMASHGTSRPRLPLKFRGLSSTARSARDHRRQEGADASGGVRTDFSFKESRYDIELGCYPWQKEHDQKSELDDGDLYEDFVDLRLQEVEKLFPEGLAGGTCGGLERATSRGTPAALLRREAADALIMTLDGYAEAGTPGIKGTSSEQWRARNSRVRTGADTEKGGGVDSGDAETATADAEAGAGAGGTGGGTEKVEEGEQMEKLLGSGPIWGEMRALAESKRKPLKGVRPVTVQPGQRSYLLTGQRGTGKSCVLNQLVLHARSTGWIVLFVPDGRNLVQKGIYCQPSPVFENLYDLPIQSLKRLKSLRDAHADQLKDISIKDPEVLARHEGAKTLLDLVDLGVDNEELAGTVHYDAMRELLATTEAKVLLAIDEYNELFQMSHWHYGDNKLEAPDLTATVPLVPAAKTTPTGLAFADEGLSSVANPEADKQTKKAALPRLDTETGAACLPPPPANGIVVCATSSRYPPVKKLKKKKTWAPFEDVAGRLAKAVAIPVEPYSRHEMSRVVKHYSNVEQVLPEPLSEVEFAKVHAKSNGLAEWVFNTCQSAHYRVFVPE